MTDLLCNTQTVLRDLLAGKPPDGIEPGHCSHSEAIDELYHLYATGGTEAVRRAINPLIKRYPDLIPLSGSDLPPETHQPNNDPEANTLLPDLGKYTIASGYIFYHAPPE